MDELKNDIADKSDCIIYIKADIGAGLKLALGILAVISAPIVIFLLYAFFYAFF